MLKSIIDKKNRKQFYYNYRYIYLLEKLLKIDISKINITDELAYIYFQNNGLNLSVEKLTSAKNLYEKEIYIYILNRFSDIKNFIIQKIFNIDENGHRHCGITLTKEIYNSFKNIINGNYTNHFMCDLTNVQIGLIDGVYQSLKSYINYGLSAEPGSNYWNEYIIKSENMVVLSETEIKYFMDYFCFVYSDLITKILKNNRFENSKIKNCALKVYLIILYSQFIVDRYEKREFKELTIQGGNWSTFEEYIVSYSKDSNYNNIASVVNNFVDIDIESAMCILPNIDYSLLYDPIKWKKPNDSSGREFLTMLNYIIFECTDDEIERVSSYSDKNLKITETVGVEN